MGRPLPDRILLNELNPIPVNADLGNGPVDAWLIRQRGTHVFDATDGSITRTVKLQEHAPEGVGQAQCVVETVDGDKPVRQLSMNYVKTFDDEVLLWFFDGDLKDGWGRFKQGEEFSLEHKQPDVPLAEPHDITGMGLSFNTVYGLSSTITFGVGFEAGEVEFDGIYAHIHNGTTVISSQPVAELNDRLTIELPPGIYNGVRIIITVGPNVESGPLAYIGSMDNDGYFNIHNAGASLETPTIEINPDDVSGPNTTNTVNPGFIASIAGIVGTKGKLSWAIDQTNQNVWSQNFEFLAADVANIEISTGGNLTDGPHTISFVIFDEENNRSPVVTYNFNVSAG